MKYLKTYIEKINEQSTLTPVMRYPVDKCLDLLTVGDEIERLHKIDIRNIPVEDSKYGKEDFLHWAGQNLEPTFPNPTISEVFYKEDIKKFEPFGIPVTKYTHFEKDSVYELPEHYDSKQDYEEWNLKKAKFKGNMEILTGKPWNDEYDKNVNYGPKSNEWVNIVLGKIKELYPQYYVGGKIRVWYDEYGYDRGKEIFDYPLGRAYFISDIENWLSDTFELDITGFMEWILDSTFVEGRWWQRTWIYDIQDKNFKKRTCSENIKTINEVLRQMLKKDHGIPIFFDYYKEIDEKLLD